jgi:hypothetical protein
MGEGSTAPAFASYASFFSAAADEAPSGEPLANRASADPGATPEAGTAPASRAEGTAVASVPARADAVGDSSGAEAPPRGEEQLVQPADRSYEEWYGATRPAARPATPAGAPMVPPAAPHRMTPSGQRARVFTPPEPLRSEVAEHGIPPWDQPVPTANEVGARGAESEAPGSTPSPAATSAPSPAWGRSPINPYLASDPNMKARRLARVLVSDMVVYHPEKREEGMRSGTLKQLFRDEIKKSYEEYVDQVGKEFAETTMHFQEALNEILAGGKRLF